MNKERSTAIYIYHPLLLCRLQLFEHFIFIFGFPMVFVISLRNMALFLFSAFFRPSDVYKYTIHMLFNCNYVCSSYTCQRTNNKLHFLFVCSFCYLFTSSLFTTFHSERAFFCLYTVKIECKIPGKPKHAHLWMKTATFFIDKRCIRVVF